MLKKLLPLTLMLTLLLSSLVAQANEVYSEPILFRGINWGATLDEAVQLLPDGVEMRDIQERERWYVIDDYMYTENGFGTYTGVMGGYTYAKSSTLKIGLSSLVSAIQPPCRIW